MTTSEGREPHWRYTPGAGPTEARRTPCSCPIGTDHDDNARADELLQEG